jgi:hypothetical protein
MVSVFSQFKTQKFTLEYRAGEFEGNFANFRSQYTSETEREKGEETCD